MDGEQNDACDQRYGRDGLRSPFASTSTAAARSRLDGFLRADDISVSAA